MKIQRFRLFDFPQKTLINQSMDDERRRSKRLDRQHPNLNGGCLKRFQKNEATYRSVQLAHYKSRWWLAYNGEPSTGGFKTRGEAVRWFARNGR